MMGADAVRCIQQAETGVGVSARYWRIFVTSTPSGSQVLISELEFRESVGGNSASIGGIPFVTKGPNNAAKVYDGSYSTYYANYSYLGLPVGVGYEHATPISVSEVAINVSNYGPQHGPTSFSIEHSEDGINWVVALDIVNDPPWTTGETRHFRL